MTLPEQSTRRLYWVQNADPDGDLGDYKGYLQDSWEEALDVAGEIVSGRDWETEGLTNAVEVLELAIVRSQIVKVPEPELDDDDAD